MRYCRSVSEAHLTHGSIQSSATVVAKPGKTRLAITCSSRKTASSQTSPRRVRTVTCNDAVGIIRNFAHFEHSSGQLVAVPVGFLGLQEFLERHRAAAVGKADLYGRGDGGHGSTVLAGDGSDLCGYGL